MAGAEIRRLRRAPSSFSLEPIIRDPLLQPEPLKNLQFYKYSSIDKSLISNHVMRHWWNFAASLFPMWMHPNLITLTGFAFIIINMVCLAIYCPDLVTPGPSWMYLSFSLGLFLYQTYDNVDGKQARKTGTSSALGHIFDHTIDSLNCALGGVLQAASMGLGHSPLAVIMTLLGSAAMWFSTWEEYHTGTLYLGVFNGPVEGLLLACVVHAISGLCGPGIWATPLVETPLKALISVDWISPAIRLNHLSVGFAVFSLCAFHIPECLINVRKIRHSQGRTLRSVLHQNIPYLVYIGLILTLLLSPRSTILEPSSIAIAPNSTVARVAQYTGVTSGIQNVQGIVRYASAAVAGVATEFAVEALTLSGQGTKVYSENGVAVVDRTGRILFFVNTPDQVDDPLSLPVLGLDDTMIPAINITRSSASSLPSPRKTSTNEANSIIGYEGGMIPLAVLSTFTFGLLGPRVILSHLAHAPFPKVHLAPFIPMVVAAGLINAPFVPTTRHNDILWAAAGASAVCFLWWATTLCMGFTKALDIGCFIIKKGKTKAQ